MSSSEVTVTYLNIILYAVSYQLQRPVEPFLVRSLIHDANHDSGNDREESTANQTYGRLTSFFSLIQTIGSPLVGTLLDRIGPRQTSILVYAGSACSYWILANATTPTLLYLSKVPTILQHAFLVGQATVSSLPSNNDDEEDRLSSAKRRAAALGRMTTAYTIGATIGPALGGYLADSNDDLYAGARLAVWGSLISVLLSIVYLKDHRSITKDKKTSKEKQSHHEQHYTFLQSVKKTLSFLRHPTVGPLLFIKLLNGISSSAFSTIVPLILANKLHFSTTQLGYFMSASSISVAAFAAVGISTAMACVGNRSDRLALVGIGCRVLSIISFGIVVSWVLSTLHDNDAQLLSNEGVIITTLASVAISLSSHVHATSLTVLTTGSVSAEERGAILGLEHGLFSMARIVGPPLGTTLLSAGPAAPGSLVVIGADGLWRVIMICMIIDFALMACLKVWSTQQNSKIESIESQRDGDILVSNKPFVDDHDHSD